MTAFSDERRIGGDEVEQAEADLLTHDACAVGSRDVRTRLAAHVLTQAVVRVAVVVEVAVSGVIRELPCELIMIEVEARAVV